MVIRSKVVYLCKRRILRNLKIILMEMETIFSHNYRSRSNGRGNRPIYNYVNLRSFPIKTIT